MVLHILRARAIRESTDSLINKIYVYYLKGERTSHHI